MFGRQPTRADVAAAARRRLAALAQQNGEEVVPPASEPEEIRSPTRHVGERHSDFGRWGLTGQQVTVAALSLLLIVVLAAWWALRSVPHAEQVTLSSHGMSSDPAPTGPASPVSSPTVSTTSTGSASLVVDVTGRVRHPGIVELPPGSRVVDALEAAGGVRAHVRLTSLNLARLLVDGEQIVVGMRVPGVGGGAPATASGSTTPAIAPVDLNTATAEQLDTLPGVGPVTAQAILQWRSDNGPFASVDELLDVSGIGDATLTDIRPYVYVR